MAKPLVLKFGKHKGRTLDEVLLVDPEYFDWLRAQTDLQVRQPDLARAFTELGVSGDNTPLHNALQAMFLDDGMCERLLRELIMKDADSVIRRQVLAERRKRLLKPIVWEGVHYSPTRRPANLLADKVELRAARKELQEALSGSDEDLLRARSRSTRSRDRFRLRGLHALYSSDPDSYREAAEKELQHLDELIADRRRSILDTRRRLISARLEIARLDEPNVLVRFIMDKRRMEERNGSDVRFQCRLAAKPPKEFGAFDVIQWPFDIWVELKPHISDDYPNLLRQMETQRQLARDVSSSGERRFVAVVGRYGGHGATLSQVRQIFSEAGFSLVLLEQMGLQLPNVSLPSAASVGELPLFALSQ